VSNFIVASAGRLIKLTRRAPAVELTPSPRRRSSGADTNLGWLSRHSSRPLHGSRTPHEPHVDLSALDLSRRH
jgi:hypothetical protein